MTNDEIKALKEANTKLTANERETLKAAACDGIKDPTAYRTRERKVGVQRFFKGKVYTVVTFRKGNQNGKSKFNWVDAILQDDRGREIAISLTALLYKRAHGDDLDGGILDLPDVSNIDQMMDWVLDNTGTQLLCKEAEKKTPDAVWNETLAREDGTLGDWDTSKKGTPTWVYQFAVMR